MRCEDATLTIFVSHRTKHIARRYCWLVAVVSRPSHMSSPTSPHGTGIAAHMANGSIIFPLNIENGAGEEAKKWGQFEKYH